MESKIQENTKMRDQVLRALEVNPTILPYMFWDNAMSINGEGKTPHQIDTEDEEGYFFALSKALLNALSLSRLPLPLSVDEIKKIHSDCVSDVFLSTMRRLKHTPGKMGANGIPRSYAYSKDYIKEQADGLIASMIEDSKLLKQYLRVSVPVYAEEPNEISKEKVILHGEVLFIVKENRVEIGYSYDDEYAQRVITDPDVISIIRKNKGKSESILLTLTELNKINLHLGPLGIPTIPASVGYNMYATQMEPQCKMYDFINSEEKLDDLQATIEKNKQFISTYDFESVLDEQQCEVISAEIVAHYEKSIELVHLDEEKIQVIVQLVRLLQRLHLFSDGNGRTMLMILLNRELIKHGLLPVIPDNPNYLDTLSTEAAVGKIREGQQRFERVINSKIGLKDIEYENIFENKKGRLTEKWHDEARSILNEHLDSIQTMIASLMDEHPKFKKVEADYIPVTSYDLKRAIQDSLTEYASYYTSNKFSLFSSHGKDGQKKAAEFVKRISLIDDEQAINKEIILHLINKSTAYNDNHSFSNILLEKLRKTNAALWKSIIPDGRGVFKKDEVSSVLEQHLKENYSTITSDVKKGDMCFYKNE